MKNTTKTMKHTEQKIHAMEASKYIIGSHVTPGSRKYSILSVFVFLSLIKAQRITLNNWNALKNNETWWKSEKNKEQLWKDRKNNEKIMENKTKTMKHDEKEQKKQWNMMKNRETTMKNDEK